MGHKAKTSKTSSRSNVDFGEERKERIARYRAQRILKGTPFKKLDDAINHLVDRGMDAEALQD